MKHEYDILKEANQVLEDKGFTQKSDNHLIGLERPQELQEYLESRPLLSKISEKFREKDGIEILREVLGFGVIIGASMYIGGCYVYHYTKKSIRFVIGS